MTTKTAVYEMCNGKKIRRKIWEPKGYIHFSENGLSIDENGKLCTISNANDWEIYEEPKPKQTVVIEKWLCRSSVGGKEYLFIVSTNDIDSYFLDWNDGTMQKVKLLDTYEITL